MPHAGITPLKIEVRRKGLYQKRFKMSYRRVTLPKRELFAQKRLTPILIPHPKEPYNLGENEFHLAFVLDDFTAAQVLHEKMGCICYENKAMGIYFINDPDDYWIEIVPVRWESVL